MARRVVGDSSTSTATNSTTTLASMSKEYGLTRVAKITAVGETARMPPATNDAAMPHCSRRATKYASTVAAIEATSSGSWSHIVAALTVAHALMNSS